MAEFSITGLQAVFAALDNWSQDVESAVDAEVQNAGIECEGLAKQACPVDTGRLRSSITYTPDHLACTVGTNVSYSGFVELGTSRQRAQPYLFPAFAEAAANLQDNLKNL